MSKLVAYSSVANQEWPVWENDDGRYGHEALTQALLMDIRAGLKKLNRMLGCPNVARGFRGLERLAKLNEAAFKRRVATAARKRVKRKGAKR